MNFPSIDIQGSIISADLLGKIRSEQASFQQGKDFEKSLNNPKLKDEISLAWQDAKAQWLIFQNKLKRVKDGDSAATETRSFWILPLLSNLGYDFQYLKSAEDINGKSFWINNRDNNIGGFPLFIAGYNESLDKRPENRNLRVSPHGLVQEYLNYSEHLYGLVTNGKQLRLLRDASRLTRLSFVEFNLEKIMEEDLYADFVIFYRLLHVSRMPQTQEGGAEAILEKYHQEGLEAGATIRNKLGKAVKDTIINLANGFINHPDNTNLRTAIAKGNFDADDYYRQQLRIIYRLLFLFVIEERNLVYAESKDPQTKRFNNLYYSHYSLLRLRKLAKRLPPPDAVRHHDLWISLINTFALFENEHIGKKMGIMGLKGDLFSYNAIATGHYDLHQCRLSNAVLMQAIKALGYFENDNKVLIAVNYGGLDVEEFGSVYEGLLELKLKIEPITGSDTYACHFDSSTERSSSGSHYTPEELVQPLIKHSLDYIIEDRLKAVNPENALLSIKVCDVACGSGHILLSAARRIAHELACLRETKAANSKERVEQPSPQYMRRALREVIRSCIYGVDKNPLAVELCKVAFWLEAHNPGEPLNFLDHHIKCGDAIVGLAHATELQQGIADEAFKALPDDDKTLAALLLKRNKKEYGTQQTVLDYEKTVTPSLETIWKGFSDFNKMPENTIDEIELKQQVYNKLVNSDAIHHLKNMADIQIAQFFLAKTAANTDMLVTNGDYIAYLYGHKKPSTVLLVRNVVQTAAPKRFFHWFLEFPDVFMIPKETTKIDPTQQNIFGTAKPQTLMDFNKTATVPTFSSGGFDCILGNPPFLGGQGISTNFGLAYLNFIKTNFEPSVGAVDFVTYFFRRAFDISKKGGFQSLISTNTIAQGDTREAGLLHITQNGGVLNHAVRSMVWPGLATVNVSLVTLFKGEWLKKRWLNGRMVENITTQLDDDESLGEPLILKVNENKSFIGSYVLGKGFVLEPHEAKALIQKNSENAHVIQAYLNGDDLNNDPEQRPSRSVINFRDYPLRRYTEEEWQNLSATQRKDIEERLEEEKFVAIVPPEYEYAVAADYPDCLDIVERLVKPEREPNNRATYRDNWWIFGERRPGLYRKLVKADSFFVMALTTKYLGFTHFDFQLVLSHASGVVISSKFSIFSTLQSNFHEYWSWKVGSTMGGGTLRYTPSSAFETFPFPQTDKNTEGVLESIGKDYHSHRAALMQQMGHGLTKLYNLFHNPATAHPVETIVSDSTTLDDANFEKRYGKELNSLRRHIEKTPKTAEFADILRGIQTLRHQHQAMDEAVLKAYTWTDIALRPNFHEVEYLPETDRVRFTIHPEARKEVLKRLLQLNHTRRAEEEAAGLWDKDTKKKEKAVKSKSAGDTQGALF